MNLLTEVYETTSEENPILMNKIFTKEKAILQPINNQNFPKLIFPLVSVVPIFGIKFSDSIKNEPSATYFKAKITRNWHMIKFTCSSCK